MKASFETTKLKQDILNSATRAFQASQEAVEIAEKLGDLSLCAAAEHVLGRTLLTIGEDEQALQSCMEAAHLYKRLGAKRQEAEVLLIQAACYKNINPEKHWASTYALE